MPRFLAPGLGKIHPFTVTVCRPAGIHWRKFDGALTMGQSYTCKLIKTRNQLAKKIKLSLFFRLTDFLVFWFIRIEIDLLNVAPIAHIF